MIVQTDGEFLPVGCLPVIKPNDVFDIAKGYGAEVKEGEDGVKEFVAAERAVAFREAGRRRGVRQHVGRRRSRSCRPIRRTFLAKLVGEYDLAGHVSVKNVPEMYRQFAIQAMQAGMQQT